MQKVAAKTIDEYIALFPRPVQQRLKALRKLIRLAAPECKEAIKYYMPTFMLEGNMLYFAAYEHHIGLYSVPVSVAPFAAQLATYKTGKGSVQLRHDEPLPLELLTAMIHYRVKQQQEKNTLKKLAKSKVGNKSLVSGSV
jgi:uncharacterized protein YdhG (YjbR/CyaY superfamily)